MWPWGHLALGYLCYAGYLGVWKRQAPRGWPVVALAVGTQFPDLVDKPLAWWLGVLPAGRSLAHSALFALPFITVVLLLAAAVGRLDVGGAFGFGYLTHLPTDVVYPVLVGDGPDVAFLLYPLVEQEAYTGPPLLGRVNDLAGEFAAFLATPRGTAYLLGELALVGTALALWMVDGMPVLRAFGRRIRRVITV